MRRIIRPFHLLFCLLPRLYGQAMGFLMMGASRLLRYFLQPRRFRLEGRASSFIATADGTKRFARRALHYFGLL